MGPAGPPRSGPRVVAIFTAASSATAIVGRTSEATVQPDIAFRPALEADLPAILRLLAQLSPGEPPMPVERAREVFTRMARNPGLTVWVGEIGGKVMATYTMQVMDNLGHNGTPAAIVESVVVDAELRGQGLGAVMMRHAGTQAAAAGCYKVALSSNRKRPDAHRFYQRIGFKPHGISFAIAV
ncbi:MAG: GNAT family N-acetyltransferase [Planctomycetes bacterium]|nr:GNAT family N-acetyltransferase [Planctomycetota bacterium]